MGAPTSMASKASLPPGSVVYIGRPDNGPALITAVEYNQAEVREYDQAEPSELVNLRSGPGVAWIRFSGLTDVEKVEEIGKCFGLHPLTLEDVVNTGLRPKLEQYEQYLLFSLKTFHWDEKHISLESNQISLVLGESFVLEFSQGRDDPYRPVMERIRSGRGRIRKRGADYLAYALMDVAVDSYYALLDALSEDMQSLEDSIFSRPDRETLTKLHQLRRAATKLRRHVWPLREAVSSIVRGDAELVGDDTAPYWRDLYDHVIQILDMIESLRENLAGLVDIYLNTTSQRMNEIMKVLTIIATIFIPLTFLAGIYGMNFKHMPELEISWAYPLLIAVMVVIGVVMLVWFWRKKWIGRQ